MKAASALIVLGLIAGPLSAQTIWRCGPEGRSFQSVPCADGERFALRAPPSADAVAEARAVVARERKAIARLAAERQARQSEAVERGLGPSGIKPLVKAAPDKAKPRRTSDKKGPPGPTVTPWATAPASAG